MRIREIGFEETDNSPESKSYLGSKNASFEKEKESAYGKAADLGLHRSPVWSESEVSDNVFQSDPRKN